jgi:hypothetical protein
MKANESSFAFFSFHLLAFISRPASAVGGAAQLPWTVNAFNDCILVFVPSSAPTR